MSAMSLASQSVVRDAQSLTPFDHSDLDALISALEKRKTLSDPANCVVDVRPGDGYRHE